ncbi:hypothetical protein SAY87_021405 [Trapa incisa]|uniref:Uncharacterized protein n=1 Tax=Trapa incisa TaxID=236973 RepID=A0AAN7JTC3_9MYRT|nr:hypothetical protein SAY87_021405 [Trapa incisa]
MGPELTRRWFHSHSTCPLCISPVEAVEPPKNLSASAASMSNPNQSSVLCEWCHCDKSTTFHIGSSSMVVPLFGGKRKPPQLVGKSVEVPRRMGLEDEISPKSLVN